MASLVLGHAKRRSVLLAAALAALLLVIGVAAYAVWSNARSSEARVAKLQNQHMEANVSLTAIRANVYRSAILTRDYLLDWDPAHTDDYVRQFKIIQTSTESSLRSLEASGLDEEQRGAVRRLRAELATYWDPTEIMLDWSPEQMRAQRAKMLRQRVGRRREIFALTEAVERLMATNFENERHRLTTAAHDFRTSLGLTTCIALLLGLGIAGGTFARMR